MKKLLLVALMVLIPATVYGQSLVDDGVRIAKDMTLDQAPAPAKATAKKDALDDISVKWLRFSEGAFVFAQTFDAIHGYWVRNQTLENGTPVFDPTTPLLSDSKWKMVTEKVAVTAAGVAVAETMWKKKLRWQAVMVMGLAAGLTYASNAKAIYDEWRDTGDVVHPTTARTIALRFAIRR